MRIAVHYHSSAEGAQAAVDSLTRSGHEAESFRADLREPGAAQALIDSVVRRFGGIDVLVNSAAIMVRTPVEAVTTAQWDEIFSVNLRAPFFCAQAAAACMRDHGGAIVNIADLAGMEAWPAYVPHGISKAGVLQMTRALARALAPGIRVNAVAPGAVLPPDDWSRDDVERLASTTPLRRIGSPEDVAQAVVFLLEADYVTGETVVVDGGRRLR